MVDGEDRSRPQMQALDLPFAKGRHSKAASLSFDCSYHRMMVNDHKERMILPVGDLGGIEMQRFLVIIASMGATEVFHRMLRVLGLLGFPSRIQPRPKKSKHYPLEWPPTPGSSRRFMGKSCV